MYPDPRVVEHIASEFIPVRVHVRETPAEYKLLSQRFSAPWTPTTLILDSGGQERHRIEGFLPTEDFLAQLSLGLAHSSFARGEFQDAERRFKEILDTYPGADAAPEAQYWEGVSRYKGTGDPAALGETARRFTQRYADSTWAKKASVWRR